MLQISPYPTMVWVTQQPVDSGWPWYITLSVILGVVFTYSMLSGICQRISGYDADDDGPIGIIWPVYLPWLVGSAMVKYLTRPRIPSARVVKE